MHPLIAQLLKTIAASDLVSHGLRLRLYCWLGLPASDTYIWSRCYFVGNDLSNVSLGDRTFFNHFCFLENGAAISTHDHQLSLFVVWCYYPAKRENNWRVWQPLPLKVGLVSSAAAKSDP